MTARDAAQSTRLGLSVAIARLMDVLREENEALQQQRMVSHSGYTDRKNQAFLELMVAQRGLTARDQDLSCLGDSTNLKELLQTNARLLKLHISAVGEVSDIIIDSLREVESDGTYSRRRHARL